MMPRKTKPANDARRGWQRIALAGAGVSVAVVLFVLMLWYAAPLFGGPAMTTLVVQGELKHVSPAEVRATVLPLVSGKGFFQVDIRGVQAAVQALPWVANVTVQRSWPHTLYVRLTEELPVARWNDAGLLDAQGHVFVRGDVSGYAALPLLSGPRGSASDVLAQYNSFAALMAPRGLEITQLTLDARGSASLHLRDGIEVRLGREDAMQRLARFGAVALPALGAQLPSVAYVDMRYTNGFAVGWTGTGVSPGCKQQSNRHTRDGSQKPCVSLRATPDKKSGGARPNV